MRGIYTYLGIPNDEAVKFHIVSTLEKSSDDNVSIEIYHVPEFWISDDKMYLLYPPENLKVSGKHPCDWGVQTFQRYSSPEEDWEEIVIEKLHTPDPGSQF